MFQELQKRQQQDYGQTRDRQHHHQELLERDADRHFPKNTSANPETSRNEPGNQDDLGWSRQHLPRARHRGGCHESASLLPGALGCPHDERHPSQRSHAMRPHQRTQRDAVKGKRDSGYRSRQPIPRPTTRQKIHSESRQKQVRQTENSQRPGERQEQVEQRPGIHRQGVPFGQKRNAAVVQRIPQRHFPAPETFPVKKSLRIAKESVVAEDESARFEPRASGKNLNINDVRKKNENEQRQQRGKAPRREPFMGVRFSPHSQSPSVQEQSSPPNLDGWRQKPKRKLFRCKIFLGQGHSGSAKGSRSESQRTCPMLRARSLTDAGCGRTMAFRCSIQFKQEHAAVR